MLPMASHYLQPTIGLTPYNPRYGGCDREEQLCAGIGHQIPYAQDRATSSGPLLPAHVKVHRQRCLIAQNGSVPLRPMKTRGRHCPDWLPHNYHSQSTAYLRSIGRALAQPRAIRRAAKVYEPGLSINGASRSQQETRLFRATLKALPDMRGFRDEAVVQDSATVQHPMNAQANQADTLFPDVNKSHSLGPGAPPRARQAWQELQR